MKWLLTFVVDYFIEKLIPRFTAWVHSVIEKFKRDKVQEAKVLNIEKQIKEKAIRDERTRKEEKDFINS